MEIIRFSRGKLLINTLFYASLALILTMFSLISGQLAFADNNIYCNTPWSIFYDSNTEKIYLGCTNLGTSFELLTIDPATTLVENSFLLEGALCGCAVVDDGTNIILILYETDGNPQWNDGKLQKVNLSSGTVIPGSEYVLDDIPFDLEVDAQNDVLFVSWGSLERGRVGKFSTVNCQIIGDKIDYGIAPEHIALTNDGSKLYVKNREIQHIAEPEILEWWEIGVLDLTDFSILTTIQMDICPSSLEMSNDYRLFASYAYPYEEYDYGKSLYVINTITDQIEEEILLADDKGVWDLSFDPVNNVLYGTVCPRDEYDEGLDNYIHRSSNEIVHFDLSDPAYSPVYFSLGSEALWDIVMASSTSFTKIFALADDTDNVYFMDM